MNVLENKDGEETALPFIDTTDPRALDALARPIVKDEDIQKAFGWMQRGVDLHDEMCAEYPEYAAAFEEAQKTNALSQIASRYGMALPLRIKSLHPDAKLPAYAKQGDAGLDLTATGTRCEITKDGLTIWTVETGIALEIPVGYVGLLFPRSSVYKTGAMLANSVGVIDSGYRGEVLLKFHGVDMPYTKGDKCGQLMVIPFPTIAPQWAEELSSTERGTGGYGSTGK